MRTYSPIPLVPYQVMLPSLQGLSGLGQPTQTATMDASLVGSALGIGTPIITTLAAQGAATSLAAGGSGLILGMAPALAVPIIGAAMAVVTVLITELIRNSGCGQTCIVTSQWANQVEPVLDQNLLAYFALPAPRTKSQQNAALANFIAAWTALVHQCSQPGLGTAGQNCISDRQAGACKWHQTASTPPYPGAPAYGACWNWWSAYHDPIANDPNVVDDSVAATVSNAGAGISSAIVSATAGIPSWVFLAGGAALILSAAMSGGRS